MYRLFYVNFFHPRRLAGKAAKRKEFKEDFAVIDVHEDDMKGDPRVWLTKVNSVPEFVTVLRIWDVLSRIRSLLHPGSGG
jgi:hypothetical protein